VRALRAPALRPGAARTGGRRPAPLSFTQTAARPAHRVATYPCGTDRPSGRADPAPAHAPPPPAPTHHRGSPKRACRPPSSPFVPPPQSIQRPASS
jgi:hypothetical protein